MPETDENITYRIHELEKRGQDREDRIRTIEQAVIELSDLPRAIDKMSDRLEAMVRLDERVGTVEERVRETSETVKGLDEKQDQLAVKVAKWGGGLVVVIFLIETLMSGGIEAVQAMVGG